MSNSLKEAIAHWKHVAPIVKCPNNNKEYKKLVSELDALLAIVGDDEKHKLMSLVDVVSHLISNYEAEHDTQSKTTGIDALKFLMETHLLNQHDLPEIASQGVLSEILHGKRNLNLRQIKLLAKRFHVNPATFIDS